MHGCARTATRPRRAHARLHKARGHRCCSALCTWTATQPLPHPPCAPRARPGAATLHLPHAALTPVSLTARPRLPKSTRTHHGDGSPLPQPLGVLGCSEQKQTGEHRALPAAPLHQCRQPQHGASSCPTITRARRGQPQPGHAAFPHRVPKRRGPQQSHVAPHSCSSRAGAVAGPPARHRAGIRYLSVSRRGTPALPRPGCSPAPLCPPQTSADSSPNGSWPHQERGQAGSAAPLTLPGSLRCCSGPGRPWVKRRALAPAPQTSALPAAS